MESNELPDGVISWVEAVCGRATWASLRSYLLPEMEYELGGRRTRGVDAVLALMEGRPPVPLTRAMWTVLPGASRRFVVMRGANPGHLLESRGGPMSAIDFAFTIDSRGLISSVSPRPHHPEPADLAAPMALGALAPHFVLPDVSGNAVSLQCASARATLVVFTCNHCPWALGWHDRIQRVARDYAHRFVRVLQLNPNDPEASPSDSAERSRKRVLAGEFASPLLIDSRQTVARAWGARHTPEVFMLDAARHLVYHGAPDADSANQELDAAWIRDALDALLAGGRPAMSDTPPLGCTIKWTRV